MGIDFLDSQWDDSSLRDPDSEQLINSASRARSKDRVMAPLLKESGTTNTTRVHHARR